MQLKEIAFVKPDKLVNPMKKHFFNKSKYFHLHCYFFHEIFMNVNNIINISSIIINNKIIDISIKPCFFSYYLLTSLLKYFLSIIELLQFQNLLLQICKFLYHSQTNNYLLHCNVSSSKISFFHSKINLVHFFCS